MLRYKHQLTRYALVLYNIPNMINNLKTLFSPREHNNYKSKLLHLSSLSFFILLVIAFQLFITLFHHIKPGVLGYASNINIQEVVDITNQYRQENGLSELQSNSKLNEAAKQKASHMFANNYWAHYSPDGTSPWWFFKNTGYSYTYAGENLARDFGDSKEVIEAWIASPTHKDNIISPKYKEIGVAVVNGVLNGEETTLVVQMFGASGAAAIPTQAVSEVKPQLLAQVKSATLISKPIAFPASIISSFNLTKSLNIALLGLLLLALLADAFLVWKYKIVRISGRSFIHFSFLAIILVIIILTTSGQIL